jgi:hypothetical protein
MRRSVVIIIALNLFVFAVVFAGVGWLTYYLSRRGDAKPEAGLDRVLVRGDYHDSVTGALAPDEAGRFERAYVGVDAGPQLVARYEYAGSLSATAYVYPAGEKPPTEEQVAAHMDGVVAEIQARYPSEIVARGAYALPDGGPRGLEAILDEGPRIQRAYLFEHNGWYVKFRVTHPDEAAPPDIEEILAEFMSDFGFPKKAYPPRGASAEAQAVSMRERNSGTPAIPRWTWYNAPAPSLSFMSPPAVVMKRSA